MTRVIEPCAPDLHDGGDGVQFDAGNEAGGLIGRIVWSGVPGLVVGAIFWHLVGSFAHDPVPLPNGAGVSEHRMSAFESRQVDGSVQRSLGCAAFAREGANATVCDALRGAEFALNLKSYMEDFGLDGSDRATAEAH